ncbi:hypothetical protein CRE_23531 [Caenorhabditis remanei]|uniref:Uncharacterized protein n=1 Tax=Caenorhabditis remanei TaxID=31234 RepID=E3MH80_CAERE|nr:hypothetical protein CRE_23531 [Caenorhabditis remanei]
MNPTMSHGRYKLNFWLTMLKIEQKCKKTFFTTPTTIPPDLHTIFTMFHVQMEIHSFNSELDLKKSLSVPIALRIAEPSSNGEKKLIDRALEEKRKRFRRSSTAYL